MRENSGREILLISYHFPPSSAVGGLRVSGFSRYLPEEGWKTCVLTLKNGCLPGSGYQEDRERIFRVSPHLSVRDAYLRLKCAGRRITNGKRVSPDELERTYIRPSSTAFDGRLVTRLKRLIASLIFLPDESRNWIVPATILAVRLVLKRRIRYILTSCPPYSVHMVGLNLKTFFPNLVWIADFRDPWVVPVLKENYPNSAISTAIERVLERRVINQASLVLTTTDQLAEALNGHYPMHKGKFRCIPNGYDMDGIASREPLRKYEKFTISYTGSLYRGRTPRPLFQAIDELHREGSIDLKEIDIKLVGHCHNTEGTAVSDLAASFGLASVVSINDPVPHAYAIEIASRSHIALLLAPGQPYQIPAKTYEYMALGTPILALTDEGATKALLDATGLGKAIFPTDIDGIKRFITDSIKDRSENRHRPGFAPPEFQRSTAVHNLAAQMSAIG